MAANECIDYIKGLNKEFSQAIPPNFKITDEHAVAAFIRKRHRFTNKGDYGNGALIAGSEGMMGAAVMCSMSFMRSGGGKLTTHIPEIGYTILQVAVPEAMAKIEPGHDHIESVASLDKYDVVGVGPGLGSYESHGRLLDNIFSTFGKPLVVDADGLNTIAKNKALLDKIPAGSVLTPHAKEFERIFGATADDLARVHLALENACRYNIVIVVKGPFTLVATPQAIAHFNTTGNPGMATAGAGDVLTGVITGLMAQKYSPEQSALLGVYLHGLAGDLAAADLSEEALIAGDVINYLGKAFKTLFSQKDPSG